MESYGNRLRWVTSFDLYTHHIYTSSVGSYRYRIVVKTKGGHSYLDFGNKSAVAEMAALIHELYKAGFTITDVNPDFVIVGETRSYNWDMMHKAAYFVANGARFIATNPDTHGRGFYPACGALCAGIEKISGRKPFYVGKPSPWIIRAALNKMQAHSEETVIVGDNLRTDILAGFQAGLETILVLSGVSSLDDIDSMPFRPSWIYPSVAEIDVI